MQGASSLGSDFNALRSEVNRNVHTDMQIERWTRLYERYVPRRKKPQHIRMASSSAKTLNSQKRRSILYLFSFFPVFFF